MRTLIAFMIAALAIFSLQSHASERQVPSKNLTIEIHGKYADRWFKIYKEKNQWICQTQDVSYFEIDGNPLQGLNWKRLSLESRQAEPQCRDQVSVSNSLGHETNKIFSCLDLPQMRIWVNSISRRCGRL